MVGKISNLTGGMTHREILSTCILYIYGQYCKIPPPGHRVVNPDSDPGFLLNPDPDPRVPTPPPFLYT
jgi:hypothetical protein